MTILQDFYNHTSVLTAGDWLTVLMPVFKFAAIGFIFSQLVWLVYWHEK